MLTDGEFLDKVSEYKLLKKEAAPWSSLSRPVKSVQNVKALAGVLSVP
jgi:hypothetical protein